MKIARFNRTEGDDAFETVALNFGARLRRLQGGNGAATADRGNA